MNKVKGKNNERSRFDGSLTNELHVRDSKENLRSRTPQDVPPRQMKQEHYLSKIDSYSNSKSADKLQVP